MTCEIRCWMAQPHLNDVRFSHTITDNRSNHTMRWVTGAYFWCPSLAVADDAPCATPSLNSSNGEAQISVHMSRSSTKDWEYIHVTSVEIHYMCTRQGRHIHCLPLVCRRFFNLFLPNRQPSVHPPTTLSIHIISLRLTQCFTPISQYPKFMLTEWDLRWIWHYEWWIKRMFLRSAW